MSFWNTPEALCTVSGKSIRDVCESAGISKNSCYYWKSHRVMPTARHRRDLEVALGISQGTLDIMHMGYSGELTTFDLACEREAENSGITELFAVLSPGAKARILRELVEIYAGRNQQIS